MENGTQAPPVHPEGTLIVSWKNAKDTALLAIVGLLGTLALSALNGMRDSVKELNEKISTVIAVQSAQQSDAGSMKAQVSRQEDRIMYLEREVFRGQPHH